MYGSPDENASAYYAQHDDGPDWTIKNVNLSRGRCRLAFHVESPSGYCAKPYSWTANTLLTPNGLAGYFYWQE